jgi:hypothetical protein
MAENGIGKQEDINPEQINVKRKKFLDFIKNGAKESDLKELKNRTGAPIGSHAEKSRLIKSELEKGVTDLRKIAENLGFSMQQVEDYRKTRMNDETELPRINRSYKKQIAIIENETDDKKLQEILDSHTFGSINHLMIRHKDQTAFKRLGDFLDELGYEQDVETVGKKLIEKEIPVKKYTRDMKGQNHPQVAWIIYNKDSHRQRIESQLKLLESLGELHLKRKD